jgi:hypothetical protein
MGQPVARVLGVAVGLTLAASCTPGQVRYQPVLPPSGTPTSVEATLYLVGDAGEVNEHSAAVLGHLGENVSAVAGGSPARPVVVAFLGDNIYELGARAENEDVDLSILDAQVAALGSHAAVRGVFIPGNHDWSRGGADDEGRAAVRLQQDWISRLEADAKVQLLPADACPGPAGVDVGRSLRLIFIDTEWLLRQPEDDCGPPEAFYERLRLDLEQNRGKRIIVMSHHPLASGGEHSGHLAPFQNGPLLYYLVKKSGASVQDLASPRYADMVRRLEETFAASGTRPLVHAAGHDHSLQVIRLGGPGQPAYQLVSGAGSKSTRSRRIDGTRYASDGFGYMRLDFGAADARLTVYARDVDGGPVRPVFACALSVVAPEDECPEAPLAEGAN